METGKNITSLSELVSESFINDPPGDTKTARLKIESTANLDLIFDPADSIRSEYFLDARIDGRGDMLDLAIFRHLAGTIKEFEIGRISSSELIVQLPDDEGIEIKHKTVPDFGLHHYEVTFFYTRDENPLTYLSKDITSVAESVYGLHFDSGEENPGDPLFPFSNSQNISKGRMISMQSGLRSGSIPEKERYKIIQRVLPYLSEDDVRNLETYDPALLKDMPTVREINGIVLQNAVELGEDRIIPVYGNRFEQLLGQLPEKSKVEISLYSSPGFINLMSHPDHSGMGTPNITLSFYSENKTNIYRLLDKVWDIYNMFTNVGLEQAAMDLKIV